MNEFEKELKQRYQNNIKDEELLDEAIAFLEHYMSLIPKEELLTKHRELALPYLALLNEKKK